MTANAPRRPHERSSFREEAHALVDWIADYMQRVESLPVLSRAEPGEIRAALPAKPPEHGESFDRVLADIDRVILPGVTHWQSPNFFGFFPANASGPAILGELLSAGLGVQGMLWSTSPACTELEQLVLDWLVDMMGLPARFRNDGGERAADVGSDGRHGPDRVRGGGVIQDTASSALLCAIIAARERTSGFAIDAGGVGAWPKPLVAYASSETHSSFVKDLRIAGLGASSLRAVAVDASRAMSPHALEAAIIEDKAAGREPFFICATVGTTSTHAMDPVPRLAEVAQRHGCWLHVDAAHAGSAAICPEFRWIAHGAEHADSWSFNPHKWMGVNFDCSVLWVADRATLVRALSVLPEYLRNRATESGKVVDYRDWQVPLGRRFRSLKLWFVIRHFGVEGLRAIIREHVRLAQLLRSWVEADPEWEVMAPTPLSLLCLRYRGRAPAVSRAGATGASTDSTTPPATLDAINEAIMHRVNGSGKAFLTHTRVDGAFVMRVSIGALSVQEAHVRALWALLRESASAGTATA
ncbi:MAG: aspartate aminotransferase family protein [Phycisphaeraceae bacterium]|nr:aspartate aminotransferase family protein [Phycisphaeraceae bacterium]